MRYRIAGNSASSRTSLRRAPGLSAGPVYSCRSGLRPAAAARHGASGERAARLCLRGIHFVLWTGLFFTRPPLSLVSSNRSCSSRCRDPRSQRMLRMLSTDTLMTDAHATRGLEATSSERKRPPMRLHAPTCLRQSGAARPVAGAAAR